MPKHPTDRLLAAREAEELVRTLPVGHLLKDSQELGWMQGLHGWFGALNGVFGGLNGYGWWFLGVGGWIYNCGKFFGIWVVFERVGILWWVVFLRVDIHIVYIMKEDRRFKKGFKKKDWRNWWFLVIWFSQLIGPSSINSLLIILIVTHSKSHLITNSSTHYFPTFSPPTNPFLSV